MKLNLRLGDYPQVWEELFRASRLARVGRRLPHPLFLSHGFDLTISQARLKRGDERRKKGGTDGRTDDRLKIRFIEIEAISGRQTSKDDDDDEHRASRRRGDDDTGCPKAQKKVFPCTELCKNIPAMLRESPSKSYAAHPKNALWRNISASHSQTLAGLFLTLLCRFWQNSFHMIAVCLNSGKKLTSQLSIWKGLINEVLPERCPETPCGIKLKKALRGRDERREKKREGEGESIRSGTRLKTDSISCVK